MTVTVIFAFDQNAGGSTNFFVLDDTIRGVLDNTTYTLGGNFSLVDVTQYVRSVNINRGRSRVLDRTQAGAATIVLDNRARLFDPIVGTAISPYSASIVPRKSVQINMNGQPIFTGIVDDWNLQFDPSGDATTTAVCSDGFLQLSQVTVTPSAKTSQASGARVGVILNEASWPTDLRDIDTGVVTLQADTPAANTNIIDYLQNVSDTEFGAFYFSRTGLATFQDRDATQNFSSTLTLGGTGISISTIQIDYGSEQIFNEVSLNRLNGGTATVTDSTSQTTYGINEYSKTGLLFNTDSDMSYLATGLLNRYKDPYFRINEVSIVVDGKTTAQKTSLATLDVTTPVTVTVAPTVGSAITQFATIDRIVHNITPAGHTMTLAMSEAQPGFVLNNNQFGELDDDQLGL